MGRQDGPAVKSNDWERCCREWAFQECRVIEPSSIRFRPSWATGPIAQTVSISSEKQPGTV